MNFPKYLFLPILIILSANVRGEENRENVLLYFLVHENEEARNAGFKAFSQDPAWKSARDESEKDGKLLVKKGVESTFLVPTDYSPLQ